MEIRLLHVPDCPSMALLTTRLSELVAGRQDVDIESLEVDDDDRAATLGMTGSPTILIDGVDPFGEPERSPSVSCRLYRDEEGRLSGVPSAAMLRNALQPDGS
ncbi:alkylmercury lyase [Kibdelosporangium aridum]|uniref:Alkylmercury lyase n=1 Tax=Kibdelosporangium aridum TaxID=2030 RepID=A0A428ZH90_KIBAR|nr:hypothetical protein [Kibdelosporangium aridum]RSM87425.1 alkylmercury lyase [Kibdelosporangium aridum]